VTASVERLRVDDSRAHLAARLEVLETRVAFAVQRRREHQAGAAPDTAVPDTAVPDTAAQVPAASDLLERVEHAVDDAEDSGEPTRLRTLQRRFGLGGLDVALLLTALAPDIDARFEQLYAFLQDDLALRRPTIGLALELAGTDGMDPLPRAALHPAGPLVGFGLIEIDDAARPFLSRTLRVPDRVTAYLLGDDTPDPVVEPYLAATVAWPGPGHSHLVNALRTGTRLFYAHEEPGASASSLFAAALAEVGLGVIEIDLSAAVAGAAAALVPAVLREVGLSGAGLVLGHADELAGRDLPALRRFAEATAIVCFAGTTPWEPQWTRVLPFIVEAPPRTRTARAELWHAILAGDDGTAGCAARLSTAPMKPIQMMSIADWARRRAGSEQRAVTADDLAAGVRHVNAAAMSRLSTRVVPRAQWTDLIVAAPTERVLREIADRVRDRDLVAGVSRFGVGSPRRGTVAMFSGPPGIGKTLAAEVLAGELGLDMYVVNLATTVNIERLFDKATEINGLLLFDDVEALVQSDVGHLLRLLDSFDGIAVLATNVIADLDEAFARRVDIGVEFTLPDAGQRHAIWRMSLAAGIPVAADIDLEFLAGAVPVSGGHIHDICLEAAFLAAGDGEPVRMEHLVRATAVEHRKLGRPLPVALQELVEA
jgi:hypothetical protein